jgi:hypothetical protein
MNILLAVVTVLGLIVAVLAARWGYTQADIARKMKARLEDQEREVTDWLVKHETLALQLSKINSNTAIARPDGSQFCIYPTIFSDAGFREKLERYVVHRTGSSLSPRSPTEIDLRSPALRQTVTKANEILDEFDKQNPGFVEYYMPCG